MPLLFARSPFDSTPTFHDQLRILHAVFSSRIAGSERYCLDLARHQAAAGHEVHLAGSPGSPLSRTLPRGVRFHPVGRLLRSWRLRRLIRRLGPDICHGHLSAACKALGGATGPVRIGTLHVGYKPHQHRRLDGVICVNHAQARRLGDYPGKARVIANWMPVRAASPAPGIRQELGLAPEVFLIGAVGRLHRSKGNDVLVSAFRQAAPANSALVIVGEGPERRALERRAAGDPRIHLIGYRPDVQACLRDLDLFVSPSREESFGLAIVEAMGAGVPIITTATDGPLEFLRHQPVQFVPPGSVSALAQALSAAFACELRRPAYDLSPFDPNARVAEIMDFYVEANPAGAAHPHETAARQVAFAT